MGIRVALLHSGPGSDMYKAVITSERLSVLGAPQSIDDIYRDLKANLHFLGMRRLSKLFICEEPLLNISYDGDSIILYLYNETLIGNKVVESRISHCETVGYLRGFIDGVKNLPGAMPVSVQSLDLQVEHDILNRIFDDFLAK